ncbi:MAG: hypothetical protein WAT12_17265, partial [Candidatus Nitrotoga sp.]
TWQSSGHVFNRYDGDAGVHSLACANLVHVMAFSQLAWCNIFMDLSDTPVRFTFADALNLCYWRIYHALPMRLLIQVRNIYANELTDMKLKAKGNTLNLTLINLCSNLFGCISFQR